MNTYVVHVYPKDNESLKVVRFTVLADSEAEAVRRAVDGMSTDRIRSTSVRRAA